MATPPARTSPRILADRYELREPIGRGGWATVYRAWDCRLGREVAVKILAPEVAADPSARARFESEATAAARISHRHVVTVFDTNERDGEPFIVMECLPGRTLADEIAAGPLSSARAREVASEVLAGLVAAHELGVVHRDIKPSNLLVAEDDSIKIADFGIATTVSTVDHTATGDVIGSAAYMAPERLEGRRATEQSDVYSLGVVLYEGLSGRKPFAGDTPAATAHAVVSGTALPLQGDDTDLVACIERAMAKRPADRFASAMEMARALTPPHLDATVLTPRVARSGIEAAPTELHPVATSTLRSVSAPPAPEPSGSLAPRASGRARTAFLLLALVAIVVVVALGIHAATGGSGPPAPTHVSVSPTTIAPVPPSPQLPTALQDGLRRLQQSVAP